MWDGEKGKFKKEKDTHGGEYQGRRWMKRKTRKQEAWKTPRAIIQTTDKLGMKAQSVTPSLIIITHHIAHSVTVCMWVSLRASWSSLIAGEQTLSWLVAQLTSLTIMWCVCTSHNGDVCVIIAHREESELPWKTQPLYSINHQLVRILTWSQAHFLVWGQHISTGRDVDQIQVGGMASFGVEWLPSVHSVQTGL